MSSGFASSHRVTSSLDLATVGAKAGGGATINSNRPNKKYGGLSIASRCSELARGAEPAEAAVVAAKPFQAGQEQ